MPDFITLGVLRHIQGISTLREQIQSLFHMDDTNVEKLPMARSTMSDALASEKRTVVLHSLIPVLVKQARSILPDRLSSFEALKDRPVLAMDGTYQQESSHYKRLTPKQNGDDNPKGHALLSFYDIRLGCPIDVSVETINQHELKTLRNYHQLDHAVTHIPNALWLVDRGFIDAKFWDQQKKSKNITMITRMKSSLKIVSSEELIFTKNVRNEGVVSDQKIHLQSSSHVWRLVTYLSPKGNTVQFLTNDFELEPGLIAFLYSRRWDEEKCFDTWKNDYAQATAWGSRFNSIVNQCLLAIITSLLMELFLHEKMGKNDIRDEKALRKQVLRQSTDYDSTDRPLWTLSLYQYTSKVSKQVVRFLKYNFSKTTSQILYDKQLKPMLLAYL